MNVVAVVHVRSRRDNKWEEPECGGMDKGDRQVIEQEAGHATPLFANLGDFVGGGSQGAKGRRKHGNQVWDGSEAAGGSNLEMSPRKAVQQALLEGGPGWRHEVGRSCAVAIAATNTLGATLEHQDGTWIVVGTGQWTQERRQWAKNPPKRTEPLLALAAAIAIQEKLQIATQSLINLIAKYGVDRGSEGALYARLVLIMA
ncbi:hypothetical protein B0H14DRAFT_2579751 [Mycena olivaceomarginata]|nr:hypothetical protein B0H14DRAFT_2579751 [Mycena olivaceomarginata]